MGNGSVNVAALLDDDVVEEGFSFADDTMVAAVAVIAVVLFFVPAVRRWCLHGYSAFQATAVTNS